MLVETLIVHGTVIHQVLWGSLLRAKKPRPFQRDLEFGFQASVHTVAKMPRQLLQY